VTKKIFNIYRLIIICISKCIYIARILCVIFRNAFAR